MLPPGYQIRELDTADAPALADAYRRNRAHLAPWEPVREESFFTAGGQLTATAGLLGLARQGLAFPYVLTSGDLVVGRISLNNVVHGVMRSGTLGYWVDAEHLGRGLAVAAVEFACEQARQRGLHRVEAGTMLHNTASQRVLERSGFEAYGVAPRLLFIAGGWRDHRLYQRILHDDPL